MGVMSFDNATLDSCYWVAEEEIAPYTEKFKEQLTFRPKFSELKAVPVYRHVDGKYGIPRHYPARYESVIDNRSIGTMKMRHIEFTGELRDHQLPVLMQFYDKIGDEINDLILRADTGAGKTVMLLKMFTELQVPTLVIVPKTDLMNQWRDRIMEFTDIRKDEIGHIQQNVCDYYGAPIAVGMLHSLCKDKYSSAFKRYWGLVIFDELHKLGAFHFSKVGGMFPARYRLGATATLRRADGLAKVFYAHLGEEEIAPRESVQPVPRVIKVSYKKLSGKIPHWCKSKIQRRGSLLSLLSKNQDRNDWVAHYAKELYDSGRQTLIIGERKTQLFSIKSILSLKYNVSKADMGIYIGETKQRERERIAEHCKIILATTSMLSLGTDIPTLRGLVFATPLSDVEQVVGRICRINDSELMPTIVDIVDVSHRECLNWAGARNGFYYRSKFEIHNL